ncbi:MAG: response regulator [Spirochaetes bacterium]|nr:response regulator [Spirochaetota bacterium]
MRSHVRLRQRFILQTRRFLRRRYMPLWLKGATTTFVLFVVPFVILSYLSINDNVQNEKESLFQNFYLRAHAFSLEVRTYLKDKVDLQVGNNYLVARGNFSTGYELPVPESVRLNIQSWLASSESGGALIEFYTDPEKGKPRIVYLEKKHTRRYFIFESTFLSQLLDVSQNISPDDRIFIYNVHEEPFLSNTIEAEYHVPPDWQAGIHKLFWQHTVNGIQELVLKETRFIIARYQLRDLPLVIYLARPYGVAMSQVEATATRLLVIYLFVGLSVFLLLMYFFRDQLRTLRNLRAFIDSKIAAGRARKMFLVRDERAEIFADIISIREHEKRARLERDDAELRTKAKADFLASMSHEIRNPLNAILGIADLLRERTTETEAKGYLQLIRDSGDSLLRIINDILDISKIENNRLTLEKAVFDIQKMIADLEFFYAAKAESQKDKIIVRVQPNTGKLVSGDPTRIRQVVINLVSNALKFTENGRVYIRVARAVEHDYVNFFVHDTGIGISKESISRIFAAYEQAEVSTTRRYGGTGLGLNIALRLARLMQGAIRCRSRIGHGTTFYCRLYLPIAAEEPRATEVPAQTFTPVAHLAKLRVLVAEDNEINQLLMVENLKPVVAEVVVAENGKEAFELASGSRFDLIFMDIIMPEMNGLDATGAIRQAEAHGNRRRTPIVALSGNAMAEDIEASMAAGCDAHLAKPVRKEDLIGVLHRLCPAETPAVS